MALRDFEKVRERIQFQLEVRHIGQVAVAAVLTLGLTFSGGYWLGASQSDQRVDSSPAIDPLTSAELPAPNPNMADKRAPVLPTRAPRQPRLARVLESIANDRPMQAATAAQTQELRVRVGSAELPVEHHVAATKSAVKAPKQPAPVQAIAMASKSAPMVTVTPVDPNNVQSLPPRPSASVSCRHDPTALRCAPSALYMTGLVGPDGAAWASNPQAGGITHAGPGQTDAPIDQAATTAFLNALDRADEARRKQDEASKAAEAAAKARQLAQANAKRAQLQRQAVERSQSNKRFFVQVKAFQDQREAITFAKLLRTRGYKPALSQTVVPEKGAFFRVRLGPYASYETARVAQRNFEIKESHETVIMTR